jgi:hypothetical protein
MVLLQFKKPVLRFLMDGGHARHTNRKTFISSSRSSRPSVQNSFFRLDFFISPLVVKSSSRLASNRKRMPAGLTMGTGFWKLPRMKLHPLLFKAVLACLIPAIQANAQRPERLAGEVSFQPDATLEKGGNLSLHQESARGSLPVWQDEKGKTKLRIGGTVRRTEFLFEDAGEWPDSVVYDLGIPLQAQRITSSNLTWTLLVTPGLASDLEQVNGKDFRLTLLGLGSYQAGPAWKWMGGLYYGQAFGESRFFPAVGAIWTPTREWMVSLVMPRPGVSYTPSRSWSFTALVQPAGGDWNLKEPEGAPDLILETWRAGIEAGWSPNPGMQLFAESGYALSRSIDLRSGDDTHLTDDVASGPYFRAGLKLY